ncbi:3-oxoacyl-[acyl-carrier-protein] synthase III [Lentzea atacamensis]|uniref:3-oxoacyl-[acyl-carrier-protein] synthase III n=1 Tax=Lentzea atacamensis TaxID=531938 RepID=A0ABX9EER5_9PSEU|nr:ketoacyl-ACP synthase III [Lentzea atacamensis]RAS67441.1 3-oxoacyl-[acyl-carrier-protein] synthase III [Lentzea atacamensis]
MAALSGAPGRPARLLGIGTYRPAGAVTTDEVAARLGTSPEWVTSRTGVLRRRRAAEDETLVAMATSAAEKALSASGRHGSDVDFVLVATMTNPQPTPAVAPRVAHGLATSAAALDVNAACAGFCYALEFARTLIAGGAADCVVVVGADRMFDIVDPDDRNTAIVFGDGAAAVVVGTAEEPGIAPAVWGSAGEKSSALEVRPDFVTFATSPPAEGRPWLRMDGTAVARWVAGTIPQVVTSALDRAGVSWRDVAAFVPHQAGGRVIARVVDQLGLPEHVVVSDDFRDMGNTSAASVPLALASLRETGHVRPGDLAVLAGFGAGLAYASQVVRVP